MTTKRLSMIVRNAWMALLLAVAPAPLTAAPAAFPAPSAPRALDGSVAALRLEGREGRTELTVDIAGGDVAWTDFTLSGPPRVVVDIQNARLGLPARQYAGLDRGGVRAVRTSQYAEDVVRLVLDLDRDTGYRVERVAGGLRIVLASGATAFAPWSSGAGSQAAAPAPRRTETRPAAPQQQPSQARRITVSFQNSEMRDVLATFAEFSGRSIIAGTDVSGIVVDGVSFSNQPWDVALRTLLQAYGLAAEELEGGLIRVDAIARLVERAAAEPVVTRPFRVNYVPAGDLASTFSKLITDRGNIVADTSTNTLVVTDVERVVRDVEQLLRQLDVPAAQVAIEAKIIFVDRTQLEALGIQYDLKDFGGNGFGSLVNNPVYDPTTGLPTGENTVNDQFLLGGPSVGAVGNASSDIDDASLNVAVSLLLANRFSLVALISALQSTELADVQATPQITTLDNRTARIFVGQEITFLTASTQGGASPTGGVTLQPVQVEAGIELEVTPHITDDGRVRLSLRAENSDAGTTNANLLNVTRQQAENQVLVADGETAVIGGLTVSRLRETRSGIPFLMDLPFIGGLFRVNERREQKQDLLILVTPHIVRQDP
ncbi:type IV pilus secretin family protein [Longimicrobium terrae]|uniref:Type IV pilus assembly protein PilQ n=2 Tax=Longimicrobium terrae TaxID=1639882 RepID=A0A841H692_9BACT|nr:type IV pilus secretin family protein [Longimicrobium terrae]MBB4639210.1 type IV pilus assembly protein PilQ [Longimicrobium terrae]MBB6073386.1 type IV pilus assembly protein PilQ [Longimicrobium terrae]NNC32626.1 AMIN domain-containing protein [Longimicrobium terrae]